VRTDEKLTPFLELEASIRLI